MDGTITSVIGPNGCGKSTVLRALGRLLRPQRGSVLLDGRQIHRMSTRDVAKVLGLLPQSPAAPEGLTVADLVSRGRHPHQSWYRQWSSDDEAAVAEALGMTGIEDLADRTLDELSGGQRQRAWLSMALAQGTDLLLLDEPTTYLDLSHQVDVLELVGRLHDESGRTVVMVLHDLNLAARYSDRLVAMKDGAIVSNAGHFNVEIDMEALDRCADEIYEARHNIDAYRLPNGKTIYVIAQGRLVNLAAGDGHPAEIMDMSFAVQAMSAEYLVRTRGQLKPGVVSVPAEIDDNIARRKLKAMGVSIDSLSCSQKEYLNG